MINGSGRGRISPWILITIMVGIITGKLTKKKHHRSNEYAMIDGRGVEVHK